MSCVGGHEIASLAVDSLRNDEQMSWEQVTAVMMRAGFDSNVTRGALEFLGATEDELVAITYDKVRTAFAGTPSTGSNS
jgi:hypothetical protein